MGRNKRESVIPVRVERLVSDQSVGDMTNLLIGGFEEGMNMHPTTAVTLASRRMISSYANRPGSLFPKSPRGVSELLERSLPDSARFSAELGVRGLSMMGEGYGRGLVMLLEPGTVAEEALALHEAMWQSTGRIGKRPSLQNEVHVRLGTCSYDLGKTAMGRLEDWLPNTVMLSPATIQTDAKYRPHQ